MATRYIYWLWTPPKDSHPNWRKIKHCCCHTMNISFSDKIKSENSARGRELYPDTRFDNLTIRWIDTHALNDNRYTCIFLDFPKKYRTTEYVLPYQNRINPIDSAVLNSIMFTSKKSFYCNIFFSRDAIRYCLIKNLLNLFYIFSNWNAMWYASDWLMNVLIHNGTIGIGAVPLLI